MNYCNCKEEWKKINGYEGYYISSRGRMVSDKKWKPRILNGNKKKYGYIEVTLHLNIHINIHIFLWPIFRSSSKADTFFGCYCCAG